MRMVTSVVLAMTATIVIFAGATRWSHAAPHRSSMATALSRLWAFNAGCVYYADELGCQVRFESLQASTAQPASPTGSPESDPQPASSAPDGVRFESVDIFADSGAQSLAAYQIEVIGTVDGGAIVLVGVEGGESRAFAEPPYYDPGALSHDRVMLAAYTPIDAAALPTGKTRVARLHVQIKTPPHTVDAPPADKPRYTVRVVAVGNAKGERVSAEFTAQTATEK